MRSQLANSVRSLPHRLSMPTVLIVPFVLQIITAVGLVGYLSFRSGQSAVNDLVNQLENQINDRVDQHLDTYLTIPHRINQINDNAIQLGLLDINNFPPSKQYFLKLLQRFDTVTSIGFANDRDKFIDVGRQLDTGTFSVAVKNENTAADQLVYRLDAQGNQAEQPFDTVKNYRPTIRPWYRSAKEANKPSWSDIYQVASDSLPARLEITAVQPYSDRKGDGGILDTSLNVSHISKFLSQIKVSPSGRIFIVERNGLLVASSTSAPIFMVKNGKAERITAAASADPLIQKTGNYLVEYFSDLNQITKLQQLEFKVNEQQQYVLVRPWRDEFGLNWVVVITVSASDFMAQINANAQRTILLCLLALVAAIALGIFTTRWIVGLILKLRKASYAIAEGDLAQTVEIAGITELEDLSKVFNQMAGQLKTAFDNKEQLVQERTQELSQALEDLKSTQQELVQSEKMAALGQLIAGIAHEINTPLGAIRASITNIASGLEASISQLPQLLQELSPLQQVEFIDLLTTACQIHPYLSTRETRKLKRFLAQELETEGIAEPEALADALIQMGITGSLEKFLPLLRSEHRTSVLEITNQLSSQFRNSENINVAVDRAAKIIYALKSYARQDTSGEKVTVNIPENIDIVLILYHNQLRQRVEVIQNYQPVPEILCYPEELSQVWTNLIHNAIQAMNYNGTLQINVFQQEQSVVVQVIDSGSGIPLEIQAQIFEPFFTTKPAGEGTGLGLDIVSKILKKHGGAIAVASQPGETTFSVFLPI